MQSRYCLSPCTHEKANTRIFVHVKHAEVPDRRKIVVKALDTDVVDLVIPVFQSLQIITEEL